MLRLSGAIFDGQSKAELSEVKRPTKVRMSNQPLSTSTWTRPILSSSLSLSLCPPLPLSCCCGHFRSRGGALIRFDSVESNSFVSRFYLIVDKRKYWTIGRARVQTCGQIELNASLGRTRLVAGGEKKIIIIYKFRGFLISWRPLKLAQSRPVELEAENKTARARSP